MPNALMNPNNDNDKDMDGSDIGDVPLSMGDATPYSPSHGCSPQSKMLTSPVH